MNKSQGHGWAVNNRWGCVRGFPLAWRAVHSLHDVGFSRGIASAVRALVSQSAPHTNFLFATERERCCNPAMTTRNGGVRWRWLVLFAMATALLPTREAFPTELPSDASRAIESAFRSAMGRGPRRRIGACGRWGQARLARPPAVRVHRSAATRPPHRQLATSRWSPWFPSLQGSCYAPVHLAAGPGQPEPDRRADVRAAVHSEARGRWMAGQPVDFVGIASAFPSDYLPTRPFTPHQAPVIAAVLQRDQAHVSGVCAAAASARQTGNAW
jgi:hypothetical protein